MKKTLLLFVVILSVSGCKGFEEGGNIFKAYKNVVGTWYIDEFFIDQVKTDMPVSKYKEVFADSSCIFSYTKNDGTQFSDTGTFSIEYGAAPDSSLTAFMKIKNIELKDFLGDSQNLLPTKLTILRLTSDDYWYTYFYNGHDYEFHLIKF